MEITYVNQKKITFGRDCSLEQHRDSDVENSRVLSVRQVESMGPRLPSCQELFGDFIHDHLLAFADEQQLIPVEFTYVNK